METSSSHTNICNIQIIYTEKGQIYSSIDLWVEFIFLFIDQYTKDSQDIFKEIDQEVV